MTRGDITVRFFGDTRDLDKKINGLSGTLDRVGKNMMAFGKTMTTHVTLPIVAGMALAVKAAADEAQEVAVLDQALKRNQDMTKTQRAEVEKQITSWQNATGILDDKLRPALGNLSRTGQDWTKIQDQMALAMDISVAKGVDVEAVTKAMGKAHDGNVGALGRLGLATKGAGGETLTFDQVLANAEKRMGGSAAAAADTAAGRTQILRARLSDMVETIGTRLLPILEKLAGWIAKAFDWFDKLGPEVQTATLAFLGLLAVTGPLTIAIGGLVTVLGLLISPVGAVVLGILALVAAVVWLWTNWDTVWNAIRDHPAIAAVVAVLFAPLAAFVSLVGGLKWLYENWSTVWSAIRSVVAAAWGFISGVFGAIVGGLGWIKVAADIIRGVWNGIFDGLHAAWNAVSSIVDTIVGALRRIINVARDVKNTLSGLVGGGLDFLDPANLLGRASGGPVTAGQPYIVGEQRPELFVPNVSGRIIPEVPTGGQVINVYVQSGASAADIAGEVAWVMKTAGR